MLQNGRYHTMPKHTKHAGNAGGRETSTKGHPTNARGGREGGRVRPTSNVAKTKRCKGRV